MDPKQAEYMRTDHCILVDCLDRPVGSAAKQDCHLVEDIRAGKALHRAFSVFLFNDKNELLLQQRAAVKPTFPNRWTNTCCSHPLHGGAEAVEEGNAGVKSAAIRKLDDELGIPIGTLQPEDFVYLTRIHYCAASDPKWGEHEIDHLMFCRPAVMPKLDRVNEQEASAIKWVSAEQLRADFAAANAANDVTVFTPWFQMIAEKLLFGWWENGKLDEILAAGGLGDAMRDRVPQILTQTDKDKSTAIPPLTPALEEAEAAQAASIALLSQ